MSKVQGLNKQFTEKDVNQDFIIDKIPFRSYKHLKYTFQEVN